MSTPAYVVRAVRETDGPAFCALRDLAGPGFTSLMADDAALQAKITASAQWYATPVTTPGPQRYMLALEHVETGEIVGCAAVKSTVGATPPFFNFRVLTIAQASLAAERRFDMDVLILVNEFTGASEVGSLFVRPEHRAGGIGRLLAQSRYLLMAAEPQRFNPEVVSELRGVVSASGVSPFWEALGRHFFQMTFEEADRLSATSDNQFILDLMPKYPIYVDLLPADAQAVIGECHPDGRGARKLLEWEGFRYEHVVDVFDGGPLMSVGRESIRTVRESHKGAARAAAAHDHELKRGLLARSAVDGFRCVATRLRREGREVVAPAAALAALNVGAGEDVLAWVDHAD
jgi:arginine N-succinyltransferase